VSPSRGDDMTSRGGEEGGSTTMVLGGEREGG